MAAPQKKNVKWFPHYVDASQSDTIEALRSLFHNDGYAFWFILLELLGNSDGMYLDLSNRGTMRKLLSRTEVSKEVAIQCLDVLAELETIDPEYWEKHQIVWCPNLLRNVGGTLKRRGNAITPPPCGEKEQNDTAEEEKAPVSAKPAGTRKSRRNVETMESAFSELEVDKVICEIQGEIGDLTERQYEELNSFREELSDELVFYAID